jgi:hypothetical protein
MPPGKAARGVNVTTHLHQVTGVKYGGDIPTLSDWQICIQGPSDDGDLIRPKHVVGYRK